MKERTNDAKRKWHWGLGLIHMYSRLMADFISKSHCYAMSVLLQQNEYCILTGSMCIYYVEINEKYIFVAFFGLLFSIFLLGKERKLNYTFFSFIVKFVQKLFYLYYKYISYFCPVK